MTSVKFFHFSLGIVFSRPQYRNDLLNKSDQDAEARAFQGD
jgi:hypothetical protein